MSNKHIFVKKLDENCRANVNFNLQYSIGQIIRINSCYGNYPYITDTQRNTRLTQTEFDECFVPVREK